MITSVVGVLSIQRSYSLGPCELGRSAKLGVIQVSDERFMINVDKLDGEPRYGSPGNLISPR